MTIEKEELKTMLEDFRGKISNAIDKKTQETSDANNKVIDELREKLSETEKALEEIKEQAKKPFGLPGVEFEKEKFSWGRYFTGLFKNHQAGKGVISAKNANKYWEEGAPFENEVCKSYEKITSKTYNANDGGDGGFLVPPQIYQGDVIDTVYANTAIMKMPVLKFENLTADMPIPVDNGNLTSYHVGENEAPTETDSDFGLKWLRPKKIGTYVRVSNRLLAQTNRAIEMIVKGKMALDSAVEMSRGLTNGIGADSEPRGLFSYYASMTGTKNISTNGRKFTIDDIAAQKMALAVANELRDSNTYGTLMHPSVLWGLLREKTEMYSGQAERKGHPKIPSLLLDKTVIENALKCKIEDTTQIAATNTVGSSSTCSRVVTGDFSKFAVATFRDPIFRVSDVATDGSGNSAFLKDESFMVMFLEYDSVCLRATSFCGFDGAQTNEASW